MNESRYSCIVAYDGTAYQGWQAQGHTAQTIAGALTASFLRTFDRDCGIMGASRTDAGVHALGQVMRLTTSLSLEPERLRMALNAHLPPDIHIRSCSNALPEFHPLHGVSRKRYYYHVAHKRPLPLISRFVYAPYYDYSCERLENALKIFEGEHDFRSFCTGDEQETTVRTIHTIRIESLPRYGVDRIIIEGPGFLRHMIRRIVGAALTIAASPKRDVRELSELLAAKNPQTTLATAPAHGLLLRKVWYDHD